jgi:hypothetical protein
MIGARRIHASVRLQYSNHGTFETTHPFPLPAFLLRSGSPKSMPAAIRAISSSYYLNSNPFIHSAEQIRRCRCLSKHQDLLPIVTVPISQPCRKSRMSRGSMRVYVAGRTLPVAAIAFLSARPAPSKQRYPCLSGHHTSVLILVR